MSYMCSKCTKPITNAVPWFCSCRKAYHPGCIRLLSKLNTTICCTQQFIAYDATLTPTTSESFDNTLDIAQQLNQSANQSTTPPPTPNPTDIIQFPPQWAASTTDDKLTFLASIFLNYSNSNTYNSRILQQSVAANTNNISTNTTNIQTNSSEITALRHESTESDRKHELVISGIPSILMQQHSRFLSFICKIRPFNINNNAQPNQTPSTDPQNATPLTTAVKPYFSLAVRIASRDVLDTVIELKRENPELKNADVFSNPTLTGLIYVNEILPSHKYQLYKRTRSYAKSKGYAFTWIQSGNIYVRFNAESDRILIFSENDLRSLP